MVMLTCHLHLCFESHYRTTQRDPFGQRLASLTLVIEIAGNRSLESSMETSPASRCKANTVHVHAICVAAGSPQRRISLPKVEDLLHVARAVKRPQQKRDAVPTSQECYSIKCETRAPPPSHSLYYSNPLEIHTPVPKQGRRESALRSGYAVPSS